MKRGPIPGVNMAYNTASRGYQGGELVDDSPLVSRPLNIAHNTLPQVFARMRPLPHYDTFEAFPGAIDGCLNKIETEHGKELKSLMTHEFQTFQNVSFLAA